MPEIAFVGPSYQSRSLVLDAQRTVNLYPEIAESGSAKSVAAMYGTPGLKLFAICQGSGGIRGMWTTSKDDRVFAVRGNGVYEVFQGNTILRGNIETYSGQVFMSDNGIELCIVDGTASGHLLTLASNAFTKISDSAFSGADTVTFIDGYFVFNRRGTDEFYISRLYNGGSYLSTDYGTAEGSPDHLVGVIADHQELWLLGKKTAEIWYNSGDPDFPFTRLQGAFVEHGCIASASIGKMDNSVFWLGADDRGHGMVWRAEGYNPRRISTHAVEYAIRQYSNIENATAYTYQQDGHNFYVLNFDTATWVYDAATGFWHERATYDADGQLTRHRASCHTVGFGRNLVGDYEDGRIYELDPSTFTDDGKAIPRIRAAPYVGESRRRYLFHNELEIEMEPGVGLDAGVSPGSTVNAMLDWSDDHGATWSNEHWASAGQIGERQQRIIWRRLGRARDRIYRITITDPVKVAIIGANLEAELAAA